MPFALSERSLDRLVGVHPDLVRIVKRAIQISEIDFVVTEGVRTLERQKQLVKSGASTTMNSRHIPAGGYSHAVDLAALISGKVSWDWPLYTKIAKAMKQAAKEIGVPLEWGGDWRSFKDGPHFQLPWKSYPASSQVAGKKLSPETDNQAKAKGFGLLGGGVAGAGSIGLDPIDKAVDTLTYQQTELTSGDLIRIAIAVVIVAGVAYLAWKKLR